MCFVEGATPDRHPGDSPVLGHGSEERAMPFWAMYRKV